MQYAVLLALKFEVYNLNRSVQLYQRIKMQAKTFKDNGKGSQIYLSNF